MPDSDREWILSEKLPKNRRDFLLNVIDDGKLVDSLVSSARITAKKPCKGKTPETRGSMRPIWAVSIPESSCDSFFNGISGYRATYLRSPQKGEALNRAIITALKNDLWTTYSEFNLDSHFVAKSLDSLSAKIWISERFIDFDHAWHGEILVPSWIEAAETYLGNKLKFPRLEKAVWGIRATIGDEIEIKGAFLNESLFEMVPAEKIDRSMDIHNYGFS